MAQLKSTKVFGDLNVTGEVNASTKITVNGKEVWDTGNLLNIGTTAATARTALGLGAGATRWPTFAEVTGKPSTYAPSGHTHPISQVTGLDAALADKADKTTQVIAGTGLTGGGTLSANRTLAVSYGTAAGTAAQGNDSRLSNSREWTASAVSQAEAEAGTATTARKWTAQRVAQAISALGLKIGTTASTAKAGNWMPTWANVTGKPSTFTPSAHTHSLSQITDAGSVASLNTNASTSNFLRGDGTWATPPNTNTTYSEITTAEIDAGTASTSRTISGRRMKYALDKKADTVHGHSISDVTGLQAAIDSKANTSTQVIAGTGLTGGGTLAANRTLAVSYGTAAGTAAQGNDSRITGALQKSQVVQATGTSTTNVMSQKVVTDALAQALASNPWISRAIGEEIWLDDSNPAVDVPPTSNSSFRYIKLTAGENGSGGYNESILINETVSGSSPLIEATAEVNFPNSPFHGQTVRLLNTERRFVRAGESGVLQDSELMTHSHEYQTGGNTGLLSAAGGDYGVFAGWNSNSTTPIGGNETRPRNIGRTIYMRVM